MVFILRIKLLGRIGLIHYLVLQISHYLVSLLDMYSSRLIK